VHNYLLKRRPLVDGGEKVCLNGNIARSFAAPCDFFSLKWRKSVKLRFLTQVTIALVLPAIAVKAAPLHFGAAPKGNASAIAAKIIKYNFPACKKITHAVRASDGSIRARCDGTDYLIFTAFKPKEGRVIELAMNCTAAKSLLDVTC
jgi:hypothetical protein